ncbi:MAG: hypothetical protein HRT87_04475, partial [Legionellales bacterium]|nr:hypothetical protein [Legionellales bacterium]
MDKQLRQQKIQQLREEFQPYFDLMGISDAYFIPKMAYVPRGATERHISMFPSELKKGTDIYTEFSSRDYDSEDPTRTLYLLKHNPFYEEEYAIHVSKSGFETYLVPVSDLIAINTLESRKTIRPPKRMALSVNNKTIKKGVSNESIIPNPEENFGLRGVVLHLDRVATAFEE